MCYFVPVFCPRGKRVRSPRALMFAVRGSLRRRSRLSPSRGSRESTPPFALSHPAVRGTSCRRSRLSHPAVRGSWRRRSRLCHPAVRGSSRRRLRINQPSVHWRWRHHPRLTLARRPASDSMPAGLPLTQCPPACLWFQLARSAADSSSPDCRWLKLAGLPLTHATGRRQGRPLTTFCSRRRPRLTEPAVRGRSRRRPWGKPTHRRRLPLVRGESQPAVHGSLGPQPAVAPSSPPAPAVVWSSQPAAAVIVKPAGYGLASRPLPYWQASRPWPLWPDSVHGLFITLLCVFSPGGLLVPLSCPMVIFWGGVQRSRLLWPGRGTRPRPPWTTGLGLLSSLLHLGLRLVVPLWRPRPVYVSVSVLRGLQSAHPPSPVELLRLGSSLPGGGSYVRGVSCVSCVPASCFRIWFVSCNYEFIWFQVCVCVWLLITWCI